MFYSIWSAQCFSSGRTSVLGREGPGSCFTTTSLLSIKLCRANTIYELADPCNATINVNVKLCHQLWEEKGPGVVLQQPVCLVCTYVSTCICKLSESTMRGSYGLADGEGGSGGRLHRQPNLASREFACHLSTYRLGAYASAL